MSTSNQNSFDDLPLEVIRRIDAAAMKAERLWQSGFEVRPEDLMQEVPERGHSVLLEELLLLEADMRRRRGESLTEAALLDRFPSEEALIRRVVESCNRELDSTKSPQPVRNRNPSGSRFPEIPGYTIERQLGRGSMGVVYLARHERLQRMVALKMVASGVDLSQGSSIIRAEAEIIARLRHPNIVQVFEFGEDHGEPFLTLEYVEGESLRELLQRDRFSFRHSAELIEKLARAIHHAHTLGVVHRDLKPANILLSRSSDQSNLEKIQGIAIESVMPKISDFGLAKVLDALQAKTHSGMVLGTPKYMSPEQAEGRARDVGPATDVYALGAILFELLAGRPPFESDSSLKLLQMISESDASFASQDAQGIPADLQAISLKCLEKAPSRRYQSALELAEDLRRFLNCFPVVARRPTKLDSLAKFIRRNRAISVSFVAVILTLVAASIGIGVFALRESAARRYAEEQAEYARVAASHLESLRARERRDVYWANIRLAQQAWQESRLDHVKQLLQQLIPNDTAEEDLRGFEWDYLWRLCHPPKQIIQGHHGDAKIAFSPDGLTFASPDSKGNVRICETASGSCLIELPGEGNITEVAFSPNGEEIAVGRRDSKVLIWNVESQELTRTLEGHQHAVRSLAFHPDGKSLVTADETERIISWNMANGTEEWNLTRPGFYVMDVAYDSTGNRLAIGCGSGTILIVDSHHGRELQLIAAHTTWLTGVAFCPDDVHVASSSGDRTARIWNLDAVEKPLLELIGHEDWLTGVAFSPDGQTIGTSSRDGTVKLWDAKSGREKTSLLGHSNWVMGVTFCSDGKHVASVSLDRTACLWTPREDWEVRNLSIQENPVTSIALATNGKQLLSASSDGIVTQLDLATGEELRVLSAHESHIVDMALSNDGTKFATGSLDGRIKVWGMESGDLLFELRGHSDAIRSLSLDSKDELLVSASDDGSLRAWNLHSGEEVHHIQKATPQIVVAFHPHKDLLASSGTSTVSLWDTSTWKEVSVLHGHSHVVSSLTFSQDGKLLATGSTDRAICVWDVATGKLLQRMSGHTNLITCLAFNGDASRVFSSSHDSTTRIWEVGSGREMLSLKHHTDWVNGLVWDQPGNRLITGSQDGTVKVIEGNRDSTFDQATVQ